jgi:hypothetical protein
MIEIECGLILEADEEYGLILDNVGVQLLDRIVAALDIPEVSTLLARDPLRLDAAACSALADSMYREEVMLFAAEALSTDHDTTQEIQAAAEKAYKLAIFARHAAQGDGMTVIRHIGR